MVIQGKNAEADLVRKNLENDLRKMGINPTDPSWQRVIGGFWHIKHLPSRWQ